MYVFCVCLIIYLICIIYFCSFSLRNLLKLLLAICHSNIMIHSFSMRVAEIWNAKFPNHVILEMLVKLPLFLIAANMERQA